MVHRKAVESVRGDPGAVVANHEGIVRRVSSERATPTAPAEDLAQEARIALWREAQKRPGDSLQGLATVVARRAATSAAQRERWTGAASRQGKHDSFRQTQEWDAALVNDAADLLDGVELAYHHGELMQALGQLEPKHREYVVLRFWGGLTEAEIASRFATSPGAVSGWWGRAIKPELRQKLAHLEGVA